MSSFLKLFMMAMKVAIPEGMEIYTVIHDRQTGKTSMIVQLDSNSANLQETLSDLVRIRAEWSKPLIP